MSVFFKWVLRKDELRFSYRLGWERNSMRKETNKHLALTDQKQVTGSKCGGLNTKNSKTAEESKRMRIAVVGAGVGGLAAAHILAKGGVEVVLYEKEDYLGGHARTVTFDGVDVDLGFMVFNRVTYPNMMEWFESMGIEMESADMSFSVSLDKGKGCEWGSRNGLSGLFAQKTNAFSPSFWQMLREMLKFKTDVLQ
ncbi:hypothetical protein ACLOJK_011286 [Asimina triloba]